jgi:hypothetical protein
VKKNQIISSTPYVLSYLRRSFDDRSPLNSMIGGFADEVESFPITRLLEMPRLSTSQTDSIHIRHLVRDYLSSFTTSTPFFFCNCLGIPLFALAALSPSEL